MNLVRSQALAEADRLMTICNACRYCEGLCAVFPAMEMRFTFGDGDLNYLANLCHQCGACYTDCQYSPPHEFNVNVPASLAKLRNDSYAHYAWPRALAERVRAQRSGRDAARRGGHRRLHHRLCCFCRSGGAVFAQRRRFLQSDAAQRHGRVVRRCRALRDCGVLVQPARVLARHQRRRAARRPCRLRPRDRRHHASDLFARRRGRLHQRGRRAVAGAAHVSPFHLLRVFVCASPPLRSRRFIIMPSAGTRLMRCGACRCCSASSAASDC